LEGYGARIVGGLVAVFLFISLIVLVVAGSQNKVSANEWGCQYGGGLLENHGLKNTIAPGKSGGVSIGDELIKLPADDRIYAIDNDPATQDFGGETIKAPAKGSNPTDPGIVTVQVPVQARFTINENACELYQNYLKKYGTDNLNFNGSDDPEKPGGWATFLNLQMNQSLIISIRREVSGLSYVELNTDFTKYPDIQNKVSTALTASLKSSLGGEFFCGPSYQFDGEADGVLTSCPPIEIVIKEITPTDPQFLANLNAIVANKEAQTVIESNKDKAIAQANADKLTSLNQTEADKQKSLATTEAEKEKQLAQTIADQETQLASVAQQQAVQEAQVAKDLIIANATKDLVAVQAGNDVVKAQAETTFCVTLQSVGVDCAEYFKALNWKPTIITGGDADLLLNPTVP
jgi:hypothetical protein